MATNQPNCVDFRVVELHRVEVYLRPLGGVNTFPKGKREKVVGGLPQ